MFSSAPVISSISTGHLKAWHVGKHPFAEIAQITCSQQTPALDGFHVTVCFWIWSDFVKAKPVITSKHKELAKGRLFAGCGSFIEDTYRAVIFIVWRIFSNLGTPRYWELAYMKVTVQERTFGCFCLFQYSDDSRQNDLNRYINIRIGSKISMQNDGNKNESHGFFFNFKLPRIYLAEIYRQILYCVP